MLRLHAIRIPYTARERITGLLAYHGFNGTITTTWSDAVVRYVGFSGVPAGRGFGCKEGGRGRAWVSSEPWAACPK